MCKHLTFPFLEKTEKTFFLLKSQTQKKNSLKKKSIYCIDTAFLGKMREHPGKITMTSITLLEGP